MPVLRKWRIFDREDFDAEGARRRDELAVFIKEMTEEAAEFEESKAYLEREARKADRVKT
jgi:acyl-[acyl-carrier-protein] desaturase